MVNLMLVVFYYYIYIVFLGLKLLKFNITRNLTSVYKFFFLVGEKLSVYWAENKDSLGE